MSTRRHLRSPSERPRPGFPGALLGLLVLGLAPALALVQLRTRLDPTGPAAIAAALSLATFVLYAVDKRRAQAGEWRIPEWVLHAGSLLGGWPGAFLGQRLFRHKTVKLGFQLVFWATVAAYEVASVDFLLGSPLLSALRAHA